MMNGTIQKTTSIASDENVSAKAGFYTSMLFTDANAYPLLSEEEEKELLRKKGEKDWPQAREKLILSNLRLVCKVCGEYVGDIDDLFSYGVIGLMTAIDRHDTDYQTRLSTYAMPWIRREIRTGSFASREVIRMPEHMRTAMQQISRAQKQFLQENFREATPLELSQICGLSEDRIKTILSAFQNATSLASLDAPAATNNQDEADDLGSIIPSCDDTEAYILKQMDSEELAKMMQGIRGHERSILLMRYGFLGQEFTLKQCGKVLNLSAERCRQLQDKALKMLQGKFRKANAQHRVTV